MMMMMVWWSRYIKREAPTAAVDRHLSRSRTWQWAQLPEGVRAPDENGWLQTTRRDPFGLVAWTAHLAVDCWFVRMKEAARATLDWWMAGRGGKRGRTARYMNARNVPSRRSAAAERCRCKVPKMVYFDPRFSCPECVLGRADR
jgi:hypothetical protein